MVLVDSNVLVYLLLRGNHTEEARALAELDPDWQSESFALVEFSNVLTAYVRNDELTRSQGELLLAEAERFFHARLVTVRHAEALQASLDFGISAYDGRFLALAQRLDVRLVTEDGKLRGAAPALTQSIAEALKAIG